MFGLLQCEVLLQAGIPLGKAEHCVFIWLGGGMSQIDTFDAKPIRGDGKKVAGCYYDITKTASSLVFWQDFSSAIGAAGTHFSASAIWPDGVYIPFLAPIAAVRLNSSSVTGTFGLLTAQGEGG